MTLRRQINSVFEGKAFLRPLFYNYSGGLRFELSEGGSSIQQMLLAMQKASAICAEIFPESGSITVCFRTYGLALGSEYRRQLRELKNAGIRIPRKRSIWVEMEDADDSDCEEGGFWISVAFTAPSALLQSLLWCALSLDLRIRPCPECSVYLLNLERRVMAFPYDDRGMDVVGPNRQALKTLYLKYSSYLLDHDRGVMDQTFGQE